jgi:hypothetical protein
LLYGGQFVDFIIKYKKIINYNKKIQKLYMIFPVFLPLKKRYTSFEKGILHFQIKTIQMELEKKLPKTPLKTLDFFHEHNVLLVLIFVIEIQYFLCLFNA